MKINGQRIVYGSIMVLIVILAIPLGIIALIVLMIAGLFFIDE